MEFELDESKSRRNRAKHGIDFIEAQVLWSDPNRLEVPALTDDEPRWVVIGRIGGKHWSAIVTHRETRIRIISVRRSREEEIELHEGQEA